MEKQHSPSTRIAKNKKRGIQNTEKGAEVFKHVKGKMKTGCFSKSHSYAIWVRELAVAQ